MKQEITGTTSLSLKDLDSQPIVNLGRVDADYDGLWTEDLRDWIMAWIDLVTTRPPLPVSQEINQE